MVGRHRSRKPTAHFPRSAVIGQNCLATRHRPRGPAVHFILFTRSAVIGRSRSAMRHRSRRPATHFLNYLSNGYLTRFCSNGSHFFVLSANIAARVATLLHSKDKHLRLGTPFLALGMSVTVTPRGRKSTSSPSPSPSSSSSSSSSSSMSAHRFALCTSCTPLLGFLGSSPVGLVVTEDTDAASESWRGRTFASAWRLFAFATRADCRRETLVALYHEPRVRTVYHPQLCSPCNSGPGRALVVFPFPPARGRLCSSSTLWASS